MKEVSVFIACRCCVDENQSKTSRGHLSAIKYFHKMHAGWELPIFCTSRLARRRKALTGPAPGCK